MVSHVKYFNSNLYKKVLHYTIKEKLGGGGMGVVYKAEDTKLKRKVALKFLPYNLSKDDTAKKRFIREARTASSLDHPNICTIYEINETDDGQIFIVMAYCEGETLKKKIKSHKLNTEQSINFAIQICNGLSKAHQKGIIHRDIKPANIMITNDGIAKIVDFGLARFIRKSDITKTGYTAGTISYLSPEQIKGKKTDQRTDLWSFGIVLYELLTGELPFRGEIDQAVIYSILNESPETFNIEISKPLQNIIFKLLEKNPDERYQNTAEVLEDLRNCARENPAQQEEKRKPTIAVLPFNNMSGDEGQEYFCDGVAEEIINALTTVKELRVIARTSSFSFKGKQSDVREIGRKLNAELILEGSVRKSNERLRITAQLINVSDGVHIWSDRYDRNTGDIFSIQDEISLSIAEELKINLLENDKDLVRKRYTHNIEAYNYYLKGRYFVTRQTGEDMRKALKYYEKAIKADPDYSRAYSSIAVALILQTAYWFVPPYEVSTKVKNAVKKAIQLEPDSPHVIVCSGLIKLFFEWDFEGAKNLFLQSIEKHGYSSSAKGGLAFYYIITGRLEEGIEMYKKELELNPLSIHINNNLGVYLLRLKKYKEAKEYLSSLLDIIPDHPYSLWLLGQVYIMESNFDKGIGLIKKALKLSGNFSPILTALGYTYSLQGKMNMARDILNQLKKKAKSQYVNPFLFGKLYTALKDKDKAFIWLEKAADQKDHAILQILSDESFENLHSDPRYLKLLKKIGLYVYYKEMVKRESLNPQL